VSSRLLVCLATYNEKENLAPLIEAIHQQLPHADVLVIDDNSPDGTGQLADELAARDTRIRVLHRPGKLGLGTAMLEAIAYAQKEGYDLLQTMDADFSHAPRYLPAFQAGMEKYDVMIGSRYVPGGGTENWPLSRLFISKSVNALVRFLMQLRVKDCSGGFRCYRVARLAAAQPERMISRGYSFQQELLYRCHRAGCKIGETPIIFENRRAGVSKVNPYEAIRSFATLLKIGVPAFLSMDR
jgi:dolichol-phosphate mannosyltransferase